MANPLFKSIMGSLTQRPTQSGQNSQQPSGQAQNASKTPQMSFQDAMHELQAHPAQLIKQAGFNVPDEIANNPQQAVMHLIQSGQIGNPMMRMVQPMLNKLMGRR
jgi:hypothetical protein